MPEVTEFHIQRAYVMWFAGVKWEQGPLKGTWKVRPAKRPGVIGWHTPNGGSRHGAEAKRFKEMGALAGIPDYFHLWGGLFGLEFKKPGGVLSEAQRDLIPQLIAAGAIIEVVDNLPDAKAFAIKHGLAISC